MKKLLFTLVACIAALSANAWTVYYQGSSAPNIWVWGNGADSNLSWPGPQMTSTGIANLWQLSANTNPTTLKFSFNGNNQTGEYTFVDGATYSSSGMIVDGGYYIIGLNNKWETDNQSTPMVRNPDDPTQYMYTFTPAHSGESFKIAPKNNSKWETIWGSNSGTPTTVEGDVDLKTQGSGNLVLPTIPQNTAVTIYFKPLWNDKQLGVVTKTLPETLYILGHINDLSWDVNNYIKMTRSESGVFEAENVNISGRHNESDSGQTGSDTGNDNYIGFFATRGENLNSMSQNNNRYGCADKNKEITSGDTEDVIFTTDDKNTGESNFKVKEGVYDITVNLNTMKATFTQVDNNPLTFDWHDANGDKYNSNNLTFNFTDPNKQIQVGVNGNAEHKAANEAVFKVEYASFASKTGKQIKRSADGEAIEYGDAEAGTHYNIVGYGEEKENLVELLKAGEYKITAYLPKSTASGMIYTVKPTTLYATVEADKITLTGVIPSATVDFSNDPVAGETVTGVFKTTSGMTSSDFIVTITPNDSEGSWASAANAEEAEKMYNDMPEGLPEQYDALKATGKKVDGIYIPTTGTITEQSDDNGSYVFNASFPCSGKYTITVSSNPEGNYIFDPKEFTITVRPCITLLYGETPGFNINGYGFNSKDPQTINYGLTNNEVAWVPEDGQSFAYTPGLYFAESLEIETSFQTKTSDTPSNVDPDGPSLAKRNGKAGYYGAPISLENVTGGSLDVYATKNGVKSDKFSFTLNMQDNQMPTGVDSIEAAEEGEAEYFNLQGVKVANPEHGIFIKVQNGKAVKVIL